MADIETPLYSRSQSLFQPVADRIIDPATRRNLIDQLLAGPVAAMVHTGRYNRPAAQRDHELVAWVRSQLPLERKRRAWHDVYAQLTAPTIWPLVEAVATALLDADQHTLWRGRVDEVIAQAAGVYRQA